MLPADAPSTADPTDRSEFTTVESKAERKKKREQEDQRRAAEERAEAKERARVEKREAAQKREQAAQRKKEADRNWATTVTPALGKLSELELPAVRPRGGETVPNPFRLSRPSLRFSVFPILAFSLSLLLIDSLLLHHYAALTASSADSVLAVRKPVH